MLENEQKSLCLEARQGKSVKKKKGGGEKTGEKKAVLGKRPYWRLAANWPILDMLGPEWSARPHCLIHRLNGAGQQRFARKRIMINFHSRSPHSNKLYFAEGGEEQRPAEGWKSANKLASSPFALAFGPLAVNPGRGTGTDEGARQDEGAVNPKKTSHLKHGGSRAAMGNPTG